MADIPKFRSPKSLIQWMERNHHSLPNEGGVRRLPSWAERCFFTCKKVPPFVLARIVARYANFAGPLGSEFERLLAFDPESVVLYARNCRNRISSWSVPLELMNLLVGRDHLLIQVAYERLPKHLEDTLSDARCLLMYAKEVIRGRLPEHLEQAFIGPTSDTYLNLRYSREIIRGFAPCRLPDPLHNYMMMKSYLNPDDEDVRDYLEAVEESSVMSIQG